MSLLDLLKASTKIENGNVIKTPITATLKEDLIIQEKLLDQKFAMFSEVYINNERIDEKTKIDVDAYGLKRVIFNDAEIEYIKYYGINNDIVVIPKGSTLTIFADVDKFDFDGTNWNITDIFVSYGDVLICTDPQNIEVLIEY